MSRGVVVCWFVFAISGRDHITDSSFEIHNIDWNLGPADSPANCPVHTQPKRRTRNCAPIEDAQKIWPPPNRKGELVHTNRTWVSIPVPKRPPFKPCSPKINPYSNASTIMPDIQNPKPTNFTVIPAAPAVTTLVSRGGCVPCPVAVGVPVVAAAVRVNVNSSAVGAAWSHSGWE